MANVITFNSVWRLLQVEHGRQLPRRSPIHRCFCGSAYFVLFPSCLLGVCHCELHCAEICVLPCASRCWRSDCDGPRTHWFRDAPRGSNGLLEISCVEQRILHKHFIRKEAKGARFTSCRIMLSLQHIGNYRCKIALCQRPRRKRARVGETSCQQTPPELHHVHDGLPVVWFDSSNGNHIATVVVFAVKKQRCFLELGSHGRQRLVATCPFFEHLSEGRVKQIIVLLFGSNSVPSLKGLGTQIVCLLDAIQHLVYFPVLWIWPKVSVF
mmetsp:Transcript_8718/g.20151  ORF Transcript_8718/g.20151 Transcript_8718/m.20151 type:complete len:268 (+) Transcript_8718:1306-2109(+)